MELNQLHYFVVVAKTENITKAAQELYITQPALSRVIGRLETEVGTKLFDRSGGRLTLNEYGKLFLEYISPALDSINTGVHAIKVQLEDRKIVICNYLITDFFDNIVTRCQAEFPTVSLEVDDYAYLKQQNSFQDITADVLMIPQKQFGSYIVAMTFKEKWCVMYNDKYRFQSGCNGKSITLSELAQEPLAFSGSEYDMAFVQSLLPDAGNIVTVDTLQESANLINRCRAVGFVPVANFRSLRSRIGDMPVSAMLVSDSPCERYIYLSRHPRFLSNADDYAILERLSSHISSELARTDEFADEYFAK